MKNPSRASLYLGTLTVMAVALALKHLSSFLLPLVIAILITFATMPIISFLQKKKVPYLLVVIIILLITVVLFALVAFLLYNSLNTLIRNFPRYFVRLQVVGGQLQAWMETRFNISLSSYFSNYDWFRTIQSMVLSVSGSFLVFIQALGLVFLFLIFFLIESPRLEKTIRVAFPHETGIRIIRLYAGMIRDIGMYLGLKLVISLATGLSVYLALLLIGMDFPLMWGLLAVILNFIPSLGSFFVMAATIIMGILQFYPDGIKIFLVAFSMIGIQVIWGNFIDPRLSGDRLKLSPLIILISLFVWGWIWGIAGMFLAVPLLSVMKLIMGNVPRLVPLTILMENPGKAVPKSRRSRRPGGGAAPPNEASPNERPPGETPADETPPGEGPD
ncbi:MAG: AI-2E family transporter [Spirochaetales bacterium]|jgi:predicted PurR-regulated permease PerM|nr:AI-2E family transporter [Spirochaetales bacterium]